TSIRLGIFGNPVAHSFSPQMQNAGLKACKIDMQYARFQVLPEELQSALEVVRQSNFIGVNLTTPHKIAACKFVERIDDHARRIGAINTIKLVDAKLYGYNTDGKGFARAIRQEFAVDLRDLRIMILGAGGAGRAIALQCAKENCDRLIIANRNFEKARQLADELREFFAGPKVLGPVPRLQAIAWDEPSIRFQIAHLDLIVNATVLGLNRSDPSPIPARLLAPHLMIYDTIYRQGHTSFVSAAIEAGARAATGSSMLLYQGAFAFEIWFEREAPIAAMRQGL
ncbi:MAG TPA: shikimate dehydrogenase, partial [Chthoniobacterales bacterium]